jgi:hypothetical protein
METHIRDVTIEMIKEALDAAHGLTLLRGVLDDEVAHVVCHLLTALVSTDASGAKIAEAYSKAFLALATSVNSEAAMPQLADAWQAYLLMRILDDSNPWSKQAEMYGPTGISPAIRAQAQRDLRSLRLLFNITAQVLWEMTRQAVTPTNPLLHDAWVPWLDLAPVQQQQQRLLATHDVTSQQLAEQEEWSGLVDVLSEHWARHGTGAFAHYHVLRWQGQEAGLQGVAYPDPIQLSSLISYEREQALLQANIERFLLGLPAHDVVLYGAPGTGKSSTVKALVNTYAERGLRLIEVPKASIKDLPAIATQLRDKAPRFLIFIDDLSFEDHETEYKALKVLLEGTAEVRPRNVLIYVTTNRLNLVRENFSDRGKPTDDVHWKDTMEEKNSLVARFGLRVTFALPNQERYLTIATELAQQRDISLSTDELRARALAWERQHVGRSGRMARQFVDDLEAETRFADL